MNSWNSTTPLPSVSAALIIFYQINADAVQRLLVMMVTSNWSSEGAIPMVFITEPNSYRYTKTTLTASDTYQTIMYSCLGGDCSISVSVEEAEGVPHLVHLGSRKPGVHDCCLPGDWRAAD